MGVMDELDAIDKKLQDDLEIWNNKKRNRNDIERIM